MSKNQSRIHPLPSQSADNNREPPPPPPAAAATCCCARCGARRCKILVVLVGSMIMWGGFILLLQLLFSLSGSSLDENVFFEVVNASLTQFDLTNNNNTLDYNLTVDINLTNPNGDYIRKIDYDEIEARAYYQDSRFESMNLVPFYQEHKDMTTTLHTVFQGHSLVPSLGEYSKLSDRFYRDKSHGSFDIQVQVSLLIKYHNHFHFLGGSRKSSLDRKYRTICCDLRSVPLFNSSSSSSINGSSSNNSSNISTTMVGGGFRTKKCKVI